MSKKISRVDKYNASADDIWAMLNSRDYVDAKYQALGDISTDVVQFDTGWSDTIDQGIIAQTFKYSDTRIITPNKTYDPNNEMATSDWVVNMEIKASVPLIGGKLEGVVEKETLASLDKEYSFNQEWLAG